MDKHTIHLGNSIIDIVSDPNCPDDVIMSYTSADNKTNFIQTVDGSAVGNITIGPNSSGWAPTVVGPGLGGTFVAPPPNPWTVPQPGTAIPNFQINIDPPFNIITRDVETEHWIHKFLRYTFQADAYVSVGEQPKCSCGCVDFGPGVLTPSSVFCMIDGHRGDVFVYEDTELMLPLMACLTCLIPFYHLMVIREYI